MHTGTSTVTPVTKADSWLFCTTKSSFCANDLRLVRHSLNSWCAKRRMEDWRKVRSNIVQSQWCYCSAWIVASLSKTAVMKVFQLGFEYGNPQSGLHSWVELPTMWNSRVACSLIRWAVARKAPRFRHSSRVMTKHSDSPGSEDLFLTLSFFEQERRGTFDINLWKGARMPRESAECDGWNVKLIWSVYRVSVHFNDGCDQFHLRSIYRSVVIDLELVVSSLPLRNGCKTSTRLGRLLK